MSRLSQERPEYFIRQRRNIVLLSIFVIFYKSAELEIEKINFLGNNTNIGNPELISPIIAIFFIYFSFRYWSACSEVTGIQRFFESTKNKSSSIAYREATKFILKETKQDKHSFHIDVDEAKSKEGGYHYYLSNFDKEWDQEKLSKYHHLSFTGWKHFQIVFEAYVKVIINETKFTEYILPFILIIIAAIELIGFQLTGNLFLTLTK